MPGVVRLLVALMAVCALQAAAAQSEGPGAGPGLVDLASLAPAPALDVEPEADVCYVEASPTVCVLSLYAADATSDDCTNAQEYLTSNGARAQLLPGGRYCGIPLSSACTSLVSSLSSKYPDDKKLASATACSDATWTRAVADQATTAESDARMHTSSSQLPLNSLYCLLLA